MHRKKAKKFTIGALGSILVAAIISVLTQQYLPSQEQYKPDRPSSSSPKHENTLTIDEGKIRVVDGDTFVLDGQRIRLWGIDAPELHQTCLDGGKTVDCGGAARVVLTGILGSGDVSCQTVDIDRYQRQVSKCKAGEKDVAEYMVHLGWAFDYTTYSKGAYKAFEEDARKESYGIWKLKFDKPADWRKGNRRYK